MVKSKSNVFSLSKEYSDHEKTIRSQMVVANIDGVEKSGEEIWQKEGYFGKINPEYNCHKNDFPENALIYLNQAYLTLKDRNSIIYCDYVILGQIVPFKLQPAESDLDEFISKDKRFVKIYSPSYDINTGEFLGINEGAGYIMLRNQEDEFFYLTVIRRSTLQLCFVIRSSLCLIYSEELHSAHIDYLLIWIINQLCRIFVFIFLL